MSSMTNANRTTNGKTTFLWLAVGWSVFAVLTGCAATQSAGPEMPDHDPFESVNRRIYRANDFLDRTIAKPVTEVYVAYAPQPVQKSVSNFFDNVVYPNVILNDFLQGKGAQGLEDSGRFLVNSTFGFLGIWDMATPLGLEAHDEDLGQTLGVWGMDENAYVVLPLVGPHTVRDIPNLGVTIVTNILFYVSTPYVIPVAFLGFIDKRARLDEAVAFRDNTAIEPYLFTREAYRQHRRFLIYDGNPPVDADLFLEDPLDGLDVDQEEHGKTRESSERNE